MFTLRHGRHQYAISGRAAGLVLGIVASGALCAAPSREMVLIAAGTSPIGSRLGAADEQPVFKADVDAFYLDRSPVTVKAFADFVTTHGYVTDAERTGSAAVMEFGTGHWYLMPGASWQYPFGVQSTAAAADHPVTQVSWHDALAYCDAQDKRLPSEVEWEHAARSGHDGEVAYAFGNTLLHEGDYLANVWTGTFPMLNTGDDGFKVTSPVGQFGFSPVGLTDMAGNVWEWTADWHGDYSGRRGQHDAPALGSSKVQRGGSFLCDAAVCHGFRVSARSHATPDSSSMHVGFRCARSS
ncbi:MAG: formylglycine-generating enzyme family protein [Pseudohongiella sp.]|uniref:formylglycine-generating enzyme family protein n=1 Tax=Pseudohongiella sp. TaxID=1979412 RepID=UPI00349FF973